MLKRILIAALLVLTGWSASAAFTDGPLTPFLNLRGRTDENGYVRISAGTAGATDGPLTAFGNLRTRTDENGYLRVACSGCGSGVTSITGTANQIAASAATGAVTLSLPSAVTMPGSLTVTGLLTANAYIGTDRLYPSAGGSDYFGVSNVGGGYQRLSSSAGSFLQDGTGASSLSWTLYGVRGIVINPDNIGSTIPGVDIYEASNVTGTSGAYLGVRMSNTFAPTSGTATYAGLSLTDTINQTGGASGITRGLYVNPTLTAAADYRAIETVGTGAKVVLSGKITTYVNIATAGLGVRAIYAAPAQSATKTGSFTVLTYTPPATAGTYVVTGSITTTSATNTGTVQMTVDYVDSQGTTHSGDILALCDASGVTAATKLGASKEFHALPWQITINNAASAIIVKVVVVGSVSYTTTASVEQVG